jgi:hypothetical protein
MSDMEGIAGVTKWPETSGGEALHADRSRLYTEEINWWTARRQFSFTFFRDLG